MLLPVGVFYCVALVALGWMCKAMVQALKGRNWRYPVCLRLLG